MASLDTAQRDEASRVRDAEERLRHRFADLPPDRVEEVVDHAVQEFEGAPVRDFVPILVEKHARDILELDVMTDAGS